MSQAKSPADEIAPTLKREADLREFRRLFIQYYDSDFPAIAQAWEDARQASFVTRKVVVR